MTFTSSFLRGTQSNFSCSLGQTHASIRLYMICLRIRRADEDEGELAASKLVLGDGYPSKRDLRLCELLGDKTQASTVVD